MEVGEEGDYIPFATLSAILIFHSEVMDKVTRQCPQITTFLTEVLPLTSLTYR